MHNSLCSFATVKSEISKHTVAPNDLGIGWLKNREGSFSIIAPFFHQISKKKMFKEEGLLNENGQHVGRLRKKTHQQTGQGNCQ